MRLFVGVVTEDFAARLAMKEATQGAASASLAAAQTGTWES